MAEWNGSLAILGMIRWYQVCILLVYLSLAVTSSQHPELIVYLSLDNSKQGTESSIDIQSRQPLETSVFEDLVYILCPKFCKDVNDNGNTLHQAPQRMLTLRRVPCGLVYVIKHTHKNHTYIAWYVHAHAHVKFLTTKYLLTSSCFHCPKKLE